MLRLFICGFLLTGTALTSAIAQQPPPEAPISKQTPSRCEVDHELVRTFGQNVVFPHGHYKSEWSGGAGIFFDSCRRFVTSAHNLYTDQGHNRLDQLTYWHRNKRTPIEGSISEGDWAKTGRITTDVAMVALNSSATGCNNSVKLFPRLSASDFDDFKRRGFSVFVLRRDRQDRSKLCAQKCDVAPAVDKVTPREYDVSTGGVWHNCASIPGESGSPFFLMTDKGPFLVGVLQGYDPPGRLHIFTPISESGLEALPIRMY